MTSGLGTDASASIPAPSSLYVPSEASSKCCKRKRTTQSSIGKKAGRGTRCPCGPLNEKRVKGFEPSTFTLATGKSLPQLPEETGTYVHSQLIPGDSHGESAAKPTADARLARLIDAWPDLPEPVRAGIVTHL